MTPRLNKITRLAVINTGSRKPGDGLKARFLDKALTGVDIFVGPNDAGKSTCLAVPIVVALGLAQVPTDPIRLYLGRRPARTNALLELDTAAGQRTVVRDLALGSSSKSGMETARDVDRYMGAPPVSWDLREFATATHAARSQTLDGVLRAGGAVGTWTVEQITDRLPAGPLTASMIAEAITTRDADLSATDWLTEAIAWAGADGGEYTRRNAAQRSARDHLTELLATPTDPIDGDPLADDADAETLRAKIATLQARRLGASMAKLTHTAHVAEGQRLTMAVQTARAVPVEVELPELPDLDVLEMALGAAKVDAAAAHRVLDGYRTYPEPDIDPDPVLAQELETAEQDRDTARAAIATASAHLATVQSARDAAIQSAGTDDEQRADLDRAKAARQAATEAYGTARAEAAAAAATLATLHDLDTSATCRHCGYTDPLGYGERIGQADSVVAETEEAETDARALVQLQRQRVERAEQALRARTSEIRAVSDEATLRIRTAERALVSARRAANDAGIIVTSAYDTINTDRARRQRQHRAAWQAEADDARQAADEADSARMLAERAINAAKLRHTDRDAALDRAAKDTAARAARLAQAEINLSAWESREAPPAPEAIDYDAEISALRIELAPITDRITDRQRLAQADATIARARALVESTTAAFDDVQALRQSLEGVRVEIVESAFRPLADAANSLLDRTGDAIPFRVYFTGPSRFGAINPDGVRVSFWELGRGREHIIAAALVYAFAVVSNAPVRVVNIDDYETIAGSWRGPLLEALVQAQQDGEVSNVMLGWQSEHPVSVPAGVTVHDLGTVPVEVTP